VLLLLWSTKTTTEDNLQDFLSAIPHFPYNVESGSFQRFVYYFFLLLCNFDRSHMAAGLVILGEEGSYILILELSANAAQSLKLPNSPQTISNLYHV